MLVLAVMAALFLATLMSATGLRASSTAPTSLQDSSAVAEVAGGVEFVLEAGERMPVQSMTDPARGWQALGDRTLNLGTESRAVWLRFPVTVQPGATGPWAVNVAWPFLDEIELHVRDAVSGEWLADPANGQGLPRHADAFPFTFSLLPGDHRQLEIYVRAHATAQLILPLRIWREAAFRDQRLTANLRLGGLLGVLAAMCCYNLSLYLFTRESRYATYALYVLSIVLYVMVINGIGQAHVWERWQWLLAREYGLLSSMAFLGAAVFIRQFLALPARGDWLLRLADITILFWMAVVALYATVNPRWLLIAEDLGACWSCVIGLGIPLVVWREGEESGRYLTIAWAFLIASTFQLMMGLSGVIDYQPGFQQIQNGGFVLEVLLLSLALAERINRDRRARLAAQLRSLRLERDAHLARERELIAQGKALDVEREARESLAARVDERTLELREALAALERANQELYALSRSDGLTQLANRRHFDQSLVAAFDRARAAQQPVAVILGDIDHFKRLNDSFGHQAGDVCLQQVAAAWRARARRGADLAARYGGEELVMLLPDTTLDAAAAIAQALRADVERLQCEYEGQAVTVTISLGVSAGIPTREDTPKTLVEAADQALYLAKSAGRNQVQARALH